MLKTLWRGLVLAVLASLCVGFGLCALVGVGFSLEHFEFEIALLTVLGGLLSFGAYMAIVDRHRAWDAEREDDRNG